MPERQNVHTTWANVSVYRREIVGIVVNILVYLVHQEMQDVLIYRVIASVHRRDIVQRVVRKLVKSVLQKKERHNVHTGVNVSVYRRDIVQRVVKVNVKAVLQKKVLQYVHTTTANVSVYRRDILQSVMTKLVKSVLQKKVLQYVEATTVNVSVGISPIVQTNGVVITMTEVGLVLTQVKSVVHRKQQNVQSTGIAVSVCQRDIVQRVVSILV